MMGWMRAGWRRLRRRPPAMPPYFDPGPLVIKVSHSGSGRVPLGAIADIKILVPGWKDGDPIPDWLRRLEGDVLRCDDFPELYELIGDSFGEAVFGEFRLPDTRIRIIRSVDEAGETIA